MKRWMAIFFLAAIGPAFATITNLSVLKTTIVQGDSLQYNYDSDRDTTWALLYLETQDSASGFNPATDRFWAKIYIVDNSTRMVWYNDSGYFTDSDTSSHGFQFGPMGLYDPPALAWLQANDRDNVPQLLSFRILPLSNPFRTVSGTVTPPAGEPKSFIIISAGVQNGDYRFSTYTDTNGNYSLPLSEAAVLSDSGNIRVSADKQYPGYIVEPVNRQVNVSGGDAVDVDFVYLAAASAVQGRLRCGSAGIGGIWVRLSDKQAGSNAARVVTDTNGYFFLACNAGTYQLEVDGSDQLQPNYMVPEQVEVIVAADDTLVQDLVVTAADAAIYGRVTKEDGAPGDNYIVYCRSRSGLGSTYSRNDAAGDFELNVSSLDTNYEVGVETGCGDCPKLPDGYYFVDGDRRDNVRPGDTVVFNMVMRPVGTGSIGGNVSLQGATPPGEMYFEIYAVPLDLMDSAFNPNNHLQSAYTVRVPGSGPYVIDSLPDSTYVIVGTAFVRDSTGNFRPFGGGMYADSLNQWFLVIVAGGGTVSGVDLALHPWGPPQEGTITGRVTYTGVLTGRRIQVALSRQPYGLADRTVDADSTGEYGFFNVASGLYYVSAKIDTNYDGHPEVYGQYPDSVMLNGSDNISGIDFAIADGPVTLGSISGQVWLDTKLGREYGLSTVVYAVPVDPAGMDTSFDIHSRLDSVRSVVVPGEDGNYFFGGLPDTTYVIFGQVFARDSLGTVIPGGEGFVSDSIGNPELISIVGGEGFSDKGLRIRVRLMGDGFVSGTITYTGSISNPQILALLFPEGTGEPIDFQPLDSTGGYAFTSVPVGSYYVAAFIDTNGDEAPDLLSQSDSLLVFTGADTFVNIDFELAEKETGNNSISGTVRYDGEWPDSALVRVWAVRVDTTLPLSEILNPIYLYGNGYMLVRDSAGPYFSGSLPDGVYYVFAAAESLFTDSFRMETYWNEFSFGIHGTVYGKDSMDFTPVVLSAGAAAMDVDIVLPVQPVAVEKAKPGVALPTVFAMGEPSPNPFNPSVSLSYAVPRAGSVTLTVYDMSGRVVRVLASRVHAPGYYKVNWNATDLRGNGVASGIYVCRMTAGDFVKNRKMILMK